MAKKQITHTNQIKTKELELSERCSEYKVMWYETPQYLMLISGSLTRNQYM